MPSAPPPAPAQGVPVYVWMPQQSPPWSPPNNISQLDPDMDAAWTTSTNGILLNEQNPASLDWAANVWDAAGYKHSAAVMRAKSAYLKGRALPGPAPMPGQQPAPQAPSDGLDDSMPPELRRDVLEFLSDSDVTPESLETLAKSLEKKYPVAAKTIRAKAALIRERFELQDAQRGGVPFKIRSGDLPYRLASWYTGTPTGDFDGDPNRWRELLPINPSLKASQAGVSGWDVGKEILLPINWHPRRKALPPVATKAAPAAKPDAAETTTAAAKKNDAAMTEDQKKALDAVNKAQESVDAIGEKADGAPEDEKLAGLLNAAEAAAANAKSAYQKGDFAGALKQAEVAANASKQAQNYQPSVTEEASLKRGKKGRGKA